MPDVRWCRPYSQPPTQHRVARALNVNGTTTLRHEACCLPPRPDTQSAFVRSRSNSVDPSGLRLKTTRRRSGDSQGVVRNRRRHAGGSLSRNKTKGRTYLVKPSQGCAVRQTRSPGARSEETERTGMSRWHAP